MLWLYADRLYFMQNEKSNEWIIKCMNNEWLTLMFWNYVIAGSSVPVLKHFCSESTQDPRSYPKGDYFIVQCTKITQQLHCITILRHCVLCFIYLFIFLWWWWRFGYSWPLRCGMESWLTDLNYNFLLGKTSQWNSRDEPSVSGLLDAALCECLPWDGFRIVQYK